jgi:hypothetical protein
MAVFIDIDWSATKHDVCALNEAGTLLAALILPHSADGLLKLKAPLSKCIFDPTLRFSGGPRSEPSAATDG